MNKYLLILFLLTSFSFAQNVKESLDVKIEQNAKAIKNDKDEINDLNKDFLELKDDFDKQEKFSEKTLDSISNQISAASFNLSIFGILFGIAAIGLGLYVTYIERKIVMIRDENQSLLLATKVVREEVVHINDQIQQDIYGLFLKIKRQETVHILDRLIKIPEDISNLSQQLLSRELEKDDFIILKEAYLKLKEKKKKNEDEDNDETIKFDSINSYLESYKLLFFQHFLDLVIKDSILNDDLIEYYDQSIHCAFENDIIKSTHDFMTAIMELGFKNKGKEINAFIRALSLSDFQTFEPIYQIVFNSLQTRENQFKFFNLIDNDNKESRIGRLKIGQLLTDKFSNTELNEIEKGVFEKTKELFVGLNKEEEEKQTLIEKQKALKEERKRKQEERNLQKK